MQPTRDKETGLIRLATAPYKGTGYYAVGHGLKGKALLFWFVSCVDLYKFEQKQMIVNIKTQKMRI